MDSGSWWRQAQMAALLFELVDHSLYSSLGDAVGWVYKDLFVLQILFLL